MKENVPEELIRLLCCPKCRQPVAPEGAFLCCINAACGLRYPVRDGIPVMLMEEAESPARQPPKAAPAP